MSNINSIEEYKELRAEIRYYFTRRDQTKYLAYALTIGVAGVGFSTSSDTSLLFLVTALLVALLFFDDSRRLRAIFRTATYIELVIEPKVEGLRWETLSTHHPFSTSGFAKFSRAFANADLPIMYLWNAAIGIYKLHATKSCAAVVVGIFAAAILCFVWGEAVRAGLFGKSQERERWERILRESSECQ
ncbi:MAG: hypothetical protein NTW07_00590 [candidate division Zixibacteria bacterium]|nr:hypothetical protein [candidate division Zixibacteria bacterium]